MTIYMVSDAPGNLHDFLDTLHNMALIYFYGMLRENAHV